MELVYLGSHVFLVCVLKVWHASMKCVSMYRLTSAWMTRHAKPVFNVSMVPALNAAIWGA
jgi:hypothetical protein